MTVAKTAALAMPDGTVHFFNGRDHVRHDAAGRAGPRPIADGWPGLAAVGFDDGIDAAVHWPDGVVHFFSGSEYVRYDLESRRVDGLPAEIDSRWPGVFDKDIDAVVHLSGRAFFFRGAEYVAFDLAAGAAEPGHPRPIAADWPGVFPGELDSASVLPDGLVYFVSGRGYVRHDPAAGRVLDDRPRRLGDGFPDPFGGVTRAAGALSPLRRWAVDLVDTVTPSERGDAAFDEVADGWDGRGDPCGYLCHWLLDRLGCTDPTLVNRGPSYVDGRAIAKLYHGGTAPFVRATPGARPSPGDVVFLRGFQRDRTAEHVFVFLSEEFTADGTVWHTAEAGRFGAAGTPGTPGIRRGRRRPLVGSGPLRLSGETPERTVIGWVDLDQLDLDPSDGGVS